jgi:TolA-binding protein
MASLKTRMTAIETSLKGIDNVVQLVLNKVENPPPPPTPVAPAVSATVTSAPTSAEAAIAAFGKAQSEKLSGSVEVALGSFLALARAYPETPQAPMAMFEVGSIYSQNSQFAQAAEAYDQVLERFGNNPLRSHAHFLKAQQLENQGSKPEAIKEYESVAKLYPGDDWAAQASARAKELKAPAPVPAKAAAKAPAKAPPKGKGKR